jgi:hypothetical protein
MKDSKKKKFRDKASQGLSSFKNTTSLLKRLSVLKKNKYYKSTRSRSRQFFRINTLSTFLFQKKIRKSFKLKKKSLPNLYQSTSKGFRITKK